jgi:hypothetical protein
VRSAELVLALLVRAGDEAAIYVCVRAFCALCLLRSQLERNLKYDSICCFWRLGSALMGSGTDGKIRDRQHSKATLR